MMFSPSTSPLRAFEGFDSAVFKLLGLAILRGKILYVDIFDNKGPVLYLINALGQYFIPGRAGIFLLQILGMTSSLYFGFRTVRLIANPWLSFISILMTLFICIPLIQEGNQCEEWTAYLLTPVLYLALKQADSVQLSNQSLWRKYRDGILMGLFVSLAFFIRPNDALAIGVGGTFGCIALMIAHGHWRESLRFSILWIVGFAIVSIPIVLWFAMKGVLPDLWYGMIGVNLDYIGGATMLSNILIPSRLWLLLLFASLWAMLYFLKQCQGWLCILFPCTFLVLWLMGSHASGHYYLILFPIFVVYFGVLLCSSKPMAAIALLAVLLSPQTMAMKPLPVLSAKTILASLRNSPTSHNEIMKSSELLFSYIPANERDSIWNYNCGTLNNYGQIGIFYHNGVVPCNRILYDFKKNNGVDMPNYQSLSSDDSGFPLWVVAILDESNILVYDSTFSGHYELVSCNSERQALFRRKNP